jgi:hypothetical protein
MEALADTFLEQAPLDYDSDAAADDMRPITEPAANSRKIGLRTCMEIFKNALENRTSSKAALKNHVPQARAPGIKQSRTRVLVIFQASGPILIVFLFMYPETSSDNILRRRAQRLRKITGASNIKSMSEIEQEKLKASEVFWDAIIKPVEIMVKDPA